MKEKALFCILCLNICLAINVLGQSTSFIFSNQIKTSNLSPKVDSIAGHGAAWGDIDGDGWADLFVGLFAYGERTNMLFRNKNGKFTFDDQKVFQFPTRPTGMVFADLDNDGNLDLYFASMPLEADKNKTLPDGTIGNSLFRNDGKGNFTNVSESSGACPGDFGGRGVAVFDYDGDGLLDILAGSDPMPGYSGSDTKNSRLFKNLGNLQFKDVTKEAGIPDNVPGYGAVACDFNNDGWPDFFLAASDGGNRLFINNRKGGFHENEKLNELFKWQWSGDNNMVCGVAIGDVNRDGLMDIVLGSHFLLPWYYPQPIRLFLNRGETDGELRFEEATLQASLPLIYIKTPHVEIQDFDNDGWPDIYTSAVKFRNDSIFPIISKNTGVSGKGIPKFVTDANDVNDFPTIEELNYERTHPQGDFFSKIQDEKRIIYFAPGPTCDYDNDGLVDIFLPSWWREFPSWLLRNETVNDNNWIKVKVQDVEGINTMGLGSKIMVYKTGRLGETEEMIGCNEICISNGYASGQIAVAHFGLGDVSTVDIEVVLPHDKGRIVREGVKANQLVTIK
jgi:hypothetical protein